MKRALLLPLALLASYAGAETNFHLTWTPTVGETHLYQIHLKFDYGSGAMIFDSDLQVKVTAVNPTTGDYAVKTVTTNAVIQSGDNTKALDQQPPVTATYSKTGLPRGDSLKEREADPFADLLQHLTEFEAPRMAVKIGDVWSNHPVGPKESYFGEPRVSYRLAELFQEGKGHFARIHYTASAGHNPEAAKGTLILDRTNNHLCEMEAMIPHFKPEGSGEEAEVSISVKEKPDSPVKSGS